MLKIGGGLWSITNLCIIHDCAILLSINGFGTDYGLRTTDHGPWFIGHGPGTMDY